MLHQNRPVDYKILVVVQQCVYETKICDISDLQTRVAQTWVDTKQNVIQAAIDKWRDRLRSCVRAGCGHFQHMLRNYCSFTSIVWFITTFLKLSM